jgi:hypothetical protein
MKKFFIILCSLIFGLNCFAIEPVYTVTATDGTNSDYTKSCVIAVNGVDWTVQGNATMSGKSAITGWGIGGKTKDSIIVTNKTPRMISCESLSYSFDSISITHKVNNGLTVDDFYVILNTDTIFASQEQIALMQNSDAVVNFKFKQVSNPSVSFVYIVTNSNKSNKRIEFSKAEFFQTVKDIPTSLVTPVIQQTSEKFLLNGQIIIRKGEEIYNIMGQKL